MSFHLMCTKKRESSLLHELLSGIFELIHIRRTCNEDPPPVCIYQTSHHILIWQERMNKHTKVASIVDLSC